MVKIEVNNGKLMEKLQQKIKINFNNKALLKKVFIHRSYVNENSNESIQHNERLEFLGDAVLELVVTEHLYNNYKKKDEGVLTTWRAALVNGANLAKIARELNLGRLLKLSKGEEKSGGRNKNAILANVMEALIGAIYLDKGYKTSRMFVKKWVIKYLTGIIEKGEHIDAKTYLQEKTQEEEGVTPTYQVLSESGPDHDKRFEIGVYLEDDLLAKGAGSSKQKAQQSAAKKALDKYDKK